MTDTAERNFLGIPITGDVNSERSTPQRTKEEFAAIMQPVLDDPTITAFGWRQYTPYFNDGETCYFNAYSPWFKTIAPAPEPVVERSYEERLLQAVGDQFPFQYVLTTANVLKMVAEALKQVPPVDLAKVLEERDRLILERHGAVLAQGSSAAVTYVQGVLADILAHIDDPEPDPQDEGDDDEYCDLDEEYGFEYGSRHGLGKIEYDSWGQRPDGTRGRLNERYEGPDEARYRRCEALDKAIQGGEFDAVLLELFGDHASITVRKTGIAVDGYSHD